MSRVFILGAGFSKAIHSDMPLLGDLSIGVKSALASKGIDIGPDLAALDDAERWLTLLGEPAPWLRLSSQMRNTALFIDVSAAIHEVVMAMQTRASLASPPPWLSPLVRHWHDTKSTVITFNYDCLVELACEEAKSSATDRILGSGLYGIPITPAALRTSSILGGDKRETFRLLKLHGSLNWWYSGPDAGQSDAIYELVWTGKFGTGITSIWEDEDGLVTDKLPMLIPPAATKGPFYRNKLLAALWVQAAEALNNADELVLMGYSAPVTDLAVTSLLATQFKGSAIIPVNRDVEIIQRARELGNRANPPDVIDSFIGTDAIAKWTAAFAS